MLLDSAVEAGLDRVEAKEVPGELAKLFGASVEGLRFKACLGPVNLEFGIVSGLEFGV